MTKLISTLLLAAISFQYSIGQPEPELPRSSIKIAPLHFFSGTFQFGFEFFNPSYSRSLNIDLGFRTGSDDYRSANGFSGELGLRKYVKPLTRQETIINGKEKSFYQGIYYNFYLQGGYFSGKDSRSSFLSPFSGVTEHDVTITYISPGFYIGLQRTLWEVLMIDIYLGGGFRMAENDYTPELSEEIELDIFDPGYQGIYPKLGIKIGIGL